MYRRCVALCVIFLAGNICDGQSGSAPAPAARDLSSPKAAVLSLYAALRAGDIQAAQRCLQFADARQAETFTLTVTPTWGPLRLMHALEARFGAAARQLFASASLEQSVDKALADLEHADVTINGQTAIIAEKKAAVDPAAETEITGITLQQEGAQWKVVASTFPGISAEIPTQQLPMMRGIANAVAGACQDTLQRLGRGEFKSANEAYAAYQNQVQRAVSATGTAKAPATAGHP